MVKPGPIVRSVLKNKANYIAHSFPNDFYLRDISGYDAHMGGSKDH
jgi:hypothetical protein